MPKGIYLRTKEMRTGKHRHSQQTKDRLRSINLGKKLSLETKRKMSLTLKGRKQSAEHIRKRMEDSKKSWFKEGCVPWNTGLRLSGFTGKKHTIENIKKYSEMKKGEKNNFWKGGITKLNQKIRGCLEYRLWRKAVFERDNYTCQECRIQGSKLCADHKIAFAVILEKNKINSIEQALKCDELWDISNGRTLCWVCHRKTDNFGYKTSRRKKFEL